MNYLLLSILLNAYIGVVFVLFKRYQIDLFQAIVYNYITCVITGSIINGTFPLGVSCIEQPWFKWAIAMGILFITVFNIIAVSSVRAGVTTTQTANKLSLIIPVLVSWYAYHEQIGWLKWTGIACALVAVMFTISKKEKKKATQGWSVYLLPVILFLGSGIIDTLTKYAEKHFIRNDATANAYLIAGFFVAAFLGFLVLLLLYIFRKKKFHVKHLFAGILLGIPNYFSIFYLIKALGSSALSSSATIPINNIGVLFVVTVVGVFVFKEKMSRLNYFGVALSILAIVLIWLGDKI